MINRINRRDFVKYSTLIPILAATGVSVKGSNIYSQTKFERVDGPKLKISLNAYSFNKSLREGHMTLDNLLEFCAQLGFDAIDPTAYYFPNYPNLPDDDYVNNFKRKAFLLGLDISGTGVRNDFTTPDKIKRAGDIELVKSWIECAAKLGAPVIRIFAGKGTPKDYSWEQVAEWMATDINECTEYSKKYGVMVAIQNHAGFLKTADDVLNILKMINSEWFGVVLDIASFRTDDPYEDIARIAPYAVTWQIKENVVIRGKEVKTDLKKIISILKDVGYRGYIPIETLGEGDPKVKVSRFLDEVRKALG